MLIQISAAKGVNKFGKKAINALSTEWSQVDALSIFKGRKYEILMEMERKGDSNTVQLIKQKKDGKINGGTYINGSY